MLVAERTPHCGRAAMRLDAGNRSTDVRSSRPEYPLKLKRRLLAALKPYPDAALAVAAALSTP